MQRLRNEQWAASFPRPEQTALDQLVWGPAMTLVFFAFLKTLEGRPDLILATIHDKFWPTMVGGVVAWLPGGAPEALAP